MSYTVEDIRDVVGDTVRRSKYGDEFKPVEDELFHEWRMGQWRVEGGRDTVRTSCGNLFTRCESTDERLRKSFCRIRVQPRLRDTFGDDPRKYRAARRCLARVQELLAVEESEDAVLREQERRSAEIVKQEFLRGVEVIRMVGQGIVHFGSASTKSGDPPYERCREFSREAASMLQSPTWSGAGPGQMEAAVCDLPQLGLPVGGIKIELPDKREPPNPYIPSDRVAVCTKFASRKMLLADAATRDEEETRTAFVASPGGMGTLNEVTDVFDLMRENMFGSKHPVPFIFLNYDGFFDPFLDQIRHIRESGMLPENQWNRICLSVCRSNRDGLEFLADFYDVHEGERTFRSRLPGGRQRTFGWS